MSSFKEQENGLNHGGLRFQTMIFFSPMILRIPDFLIWLNTFSQSHLSLYWRGGIMTVENDKKLPTPCVFPAPNPHCKIEAPQNELFSWMISVYTTPLTGLWKQWTAPELCISIIQGLSFGDWQMINEVWFLCVYQSAVTGHNLLSCTILPCRGIAFSASFSDKMLCQKLYSDYVNEFSVPTD